MIIQKHLTGVKNQNPIIKVIWTRNIIINCFFKEEKTFLNFTETISLEMTTQNQLRVPIESQDSVKNFDDSPKLKNNFLRKAVKTTLLIIPFVILLLLYLVYIGGGKL